MMVFSLVALTGLASAAEFSWGTATAAYQVEGSREVGGRQPCIWDCFDSNLEGVSGNPCEAIKSYKPNNNTNVFKGENAATADDDFDRYPQTVEELKKFGFGAYRMSIAWDRVMTYDTSDGENPVGRVNQDGVNHYIKVLKTLKEANIDVALTMWHWDTPNALENYAYKNPGCKGTSSNTKTGSFWLCNDAHVFFSEYAKLLVSEFGTKLGTQSPVKWWITLNEPLTVAQNGYSGSGPHAPGRCSNRELCWDGDDSSEPFIAAHNMLRGHAEAFHAWKAAHLEHSLCGITLNGDYALAADPNSPADLQAADRSMEYQMATFADPIFYGRWPESLVKAAGAGLIHLPELDRGLIYGTHAGVYFQNHYTTNFVWDAKKPGTSGFTASANFSSSGYHPVSKKPIGTPSSNGWLYDYPPGLPLIQNWLHKRYPNASFIVTENGWGNATATEAEDVKDLIRCNFYRNYVGNMSKNAARPGGPDVRGFFAWSIMDNYEWADGFSTRFGLTYVDYTSQVRTPKLSMKWWGEVTKRKSLPPKGNEELPVCSCCVYTPKTGSRNNGVAAFTYTPTPSLARRWQCKCR